MTSPAVLKRVRDLMARAADPGATEEEQRSCAHIAAKLCREHKITIGELGASAPAAAPPVTRVHAELVINGVRTVFNGLSQGLGFDLVDFARELVRERVKESLTSTLAKPKPARRRKPKPKAKP